MCLSPKNYYKTSEELTTSQIYDAFIVLLLIVELGSPSSHSLYKWTIPLRHKYLNSLEVLLPNSLEMFCVVCDELQRSFIFGWKVNKNERIPHYVLFFYFLYSLIIWSLSLFLMPS